MTTFYGFPQDAHNYSADEVGKALAGLISRESSGLPKTGMLGVGPLVTAVAASWQVQIGPFGYVHQVSGSAQISGLSSAEQVDITPAIGIPVGQGRIDRVCWDPAVAQLVKVEGIVSASPLVPAIGALVPVAQAHVNSGDGMVIAGRVIADFPRTQLATSRQSGVISHPAGGSALSSPIFTSPNRSVVFPKPFDMVPRVLATAAANDATVAQWAQIYGVTKTGFSYRIVSVVAAPRAGTLSWEADV